jgi:D-3-phosphoglycerate dehydrogenase
MAKVFVTARFDGEVLAWLRRDHEITFGSWRDTGLFPTGDELVERLNGGAHDIYVNEGDKVPASVIERLETTRLICVARGTPDNVDITAATEAGILVTNAPGRNAVAVAEFTIGLILDRIRHITLSNHMVMARTWQFRRFEEIEGIELNGRTIGLVGVGYIGQEVAQRLRAFNMRVLGYDPYVDPEIAASAGVELVGLDRLMRESDFISIHAAVTPETKGLIGEREIALMKPTAYFINTARAIITDEQALHAALRDGRIVGAALDVFLEEPVTPDHPLAMLDNVLVTPHLGGATREVVTNHSLMIERDIQAYVAGRRPPHAKNPEVWN